MTLRPTKSAKPSTPAQTRCKKSAHPPRAIFDQKSLYEELSTEARAVGIPDGMAEPIADKVARAVSTWVSGREIITAEDLDRRVALEVAKYSADLAYVYENRGTII